MALGAPGVAWRRRHREAILARCFSSPSSRPHAGQTPSSTRSSFATWSLRWRASGASGSPAPTRAGLPNWLKPVTATGTAHVASPQPRRPQPRRPQPRRPQPSQPRCPWRALQPLRAALVPRRPLPPVLPLLRPLPPVLPPPRRSPLPAPWVRQRYLASRQPPALAPARLPRERGRHPRSTRAPQAAQGPKAVRGPAEEASTLKRRSFSATFGGRRAFGRQCWPYRCSACLRYLPNLVAGPSTRSGTSRHFSYGAALP